MSDSSSSIDQCRMLSLLDFFDVIRRGYDMLKIDLTNDDLIELQKAYRTQSKNCRNKPLTRLGERVQMRLTFDEWLSTWLESGKIRQRGKGRDKYVMGRIGDDGHYELGNVYIVRGDLNNALARHSASSKRLSKSTVREIYEQHQRTKIFDICKLYGISFKTAQNIRAATGAYKWLLEKPLLNSTLVF